MTEEEKSNENVDLIRGDYKVALRRIAGPLVLTLVLTMVYNLVDRIWIAGLGPDPLAAVGFIVPVFILVVGIGNGFGAGSNSLIARFIGANDKPNANNSALHGVLMALIVSILIPIILLPFLDQILVYMGASEVFGYAKEYSQIVIIGSFALVLNTVLSSQLRAEGDIRRATIALVITAVVNIVLDPIFIYTLGLGVSGAAIATILSACIATVLMLYWMFIKKDTYVDMSLNQFHLDSTILRLFIAVAIPASVEQMIISFINVIMNYILATVGSTDIVAAFTAAFSIINLAMMVTIGIATAAITVAGVNFGARKFKTVNLTYNYAVLLALGCGLIVLIILELFAPQVSILFSYTSSSAGLNILVADVLRKISPFLIALPLGVCASTVFQGMGKGTISLGLTLLREFLLVVGFDILLVYVFDFGPDGVYYSLWSGVLIGSLISYFVFKWYIRRYEHFHEPSDSQLNELT